jgi:excisionase family DNA binding protein
VEETMTTRRAVTVMEAAQTLGVSRVHAYRLVADGTLPSFRLGRTVRIPADAIEAMLRAGRA